MQTQSALLQLLSDVTLDVEASTHLPKLKAAVSTGGPPRLKEKAAGPAYTPSSEVRSCFL